MSSISAIGYRGTAKMDAVTPKDWNRTLLPHKQAMYAFKVEGASLEFCHIKENDTVIIDTSLKPIRGDVVLSVLDGELVLGQFEFIDEDFYICSGENQSKLNDHSLAHILGVVSSLVRDYDRPC